MTDQGDEPSDGPHQVHLGHLDLVLTAVRVGGSGACPPPAQCMLNAAANPPARPPPPYPPLYLQRGPGGKTVLATEDGQLALGDPSSPPPTDGGGDPRRCGLTPLQAAGRVALSSAALAAEGTLLRWKDGGSTARVRLDLYLPEACFLEGRTGWAANPAAAALWAWTRDPESGLAPGEADAAAPSGTPAPSAPSLAAVFDALPARPPDPARRATGAGTGGPGPAGLLSLPPELLRAVAGCLGCARALAAFGATCSAARDAASDAVPGLDLKLFPHQRAAVRWMAERERGSGEEGGGEAGSTTRHPAWRPLAWRAVKNGPALPRPPPLWASLVTGELAPHTPPRAAGARGGLLCDEPGLGKTVTALALILRSRGGVPPPPPGATLARSPCGRGWLYSEAAVEEEGGCGGASGASHSTMPAPGPTSPSSSTPRRPGAPPRRAAAIAATESPTGRRASAEDAALVRARAAVARAAVAGAAKKKRTHRQDTHAMTTLLWVACDACGRWRSLGAAGTAPSPSPGVSWVCAQHPDPAVASCDAPAEEEDEGEGMDGGGGVAVAAGPQTPGSGGAAAAAAAAPADPDAHAYWAAAAAACARGALPPPPGWVVVGDTTTTTAPPPPSHPPADGAARFTALLAADPALADWPSVAWWVASLPPGTLSAPHGARPPRELRAPGGAERWGAFLATLGLEPAPPEAPVPPPLTTPTKRGAKAARAVGGGGAAAAASDADAAWARVRTPPALAHLTPDAATLRAALLRGGRRALRTFYLSPATLLVVPPALEAHWVDQVARHVSGGLRVRVLSNVGGGGGGHSAHATSPAASPQDLAWGSDLVITTFARLSSEWGRRHGSGGGGGAAATAGGGGGAHKEQRATPTQPEAAAPLLHIHWARIILDEGHVLSAGSGALTSRLATACALRGDRRWVLTGTPAPASPADAVPRLHPLLAFLRHDPYGKGTRRTFDAVLARPWEARSPAAGARLGALLREVMIRASKAGAGALLPHVTRTVARIPFTPSHAAAYNTLVDGIDRSLLLADWGDPDHRESLLNARLNAKLAREMAANVRLACCVSGAFDDLAVSEPDLQETLEILAKRHALAPPAPPGSGPPWVLPSHPLAPVEAGLRAGCACAACAAWTRLPIVTPCAHLVCVECAAPARTACPVCGEGYDMQAVGDPARKLTNPAPKWEVPLEVIEDQPAYSQAHAAGSAGDKAGSSTAMWAPRWQRAPSSKVAHLIRRLQDLGIARPPAPATTPAAAAASPARPATTAAQMKKTKKMKAIVFTQFWPHMLLVGHALDSAGVHSVVIQSKMTPAQRAAAVDEFRFDETAGVLVMDASGAVGLDLSCANAVFLMEPLPDAALEAQVIARAWRMGNPRPVGVETLVMAGTVEEEVLAQRAAEEGVAGEAGAAPAPRAAFAGSAAAVQAARGLSDADRAARMRVRILSHLRRVI